MRRGEPLFAVVNYEATWREPLKSWARRHKLGWLILDESHRAKGAGGKASMHLVTLGRRARHRMGLTGTLMPHSPLDAYAQFKIIAPDIFGGSLAAFRGRYCRMGGFAEREIVEWLNQEELGRKIASVSFQVGREVLDLPDRQDTVIPVELGPAASKLYAALHKELYADLNTIKDKLRQAWKLVYGSDADDDPLVTLYGLQDSPTGSSLLAAMTGEVTVANAMVKALRLRQIACGFTKNDNGRIVVVGDEKAKALQDFLADLPKDEPTVTFCAFQPDLDAVARVSGQAGRTCLELSGRVNQLTEWQRGGAADLAVQIQAGGTGVDLTRACYEFYYSITNSNGDYQQARCRVLRPGQVRRVSTYHLVHPGSDAKLYRSHERRQALVDQVLSIGRN